MHAEQRKYTTAAGMYTESVAKSILFAYSVNMGAIKGIILDKDGTLFDYGVVWGPVLSAAISRGLAKANMPNERKNECIQDFCRIVGVDGDGKTYPDGIIFRHDKLLRATMRVLSLTFHYRMNPWRVWKSVKGLLNHEDFGLSERLEHMEFPYVKEVIKAMHYRGYIIGIVTTDTTISTELFLKKMGITEYISFMRTKDSPTAKKPNPEAIREFCAEFSLNSDEVAVIGDTIVDMEFAHHGKAGYAVAVLTGSGDKEGLEERADAVYPELKDILNDKVLFSDR